MPLLDSLIIGGGQAGLAAAYALSRRGLQPLIVEAGPAPTGSWPRYYDSLTLFSPAGSSALPGMAFPGDPARYPTRDEVAAYLATYAAGLGVPIDTDTRVATVTWTGTGFTAVTVDGREYTARSVVSATGGFGRPYRPDLPGLSAFAGRILHAADYRTPAPFAGQRIVVVGAGNSAVQIAAELAATAQVTLTSRHPVRLRAQRPLGLDIHTWLRWSGLDHAPLGRLLAARSVDVLDDGRYRAALAAGRPTWRPLFTRLGTDTVWWSDGTSEPVDAVILATGYRPELAHLAGCTGPDGRPALAPDARPHHAGGVSTTVPGLGYVGLPGQRSLASATLRGAGRDASRVVRRLTAAPPARSVPVGR